MSSYKKRVIGILIIVFSIIVVAIICAENFSCSNASKVVGTYQGDVLQITLNDNETFNYYLASTGASAEGKYSCTMATDGKTANIKLQVTSGYCSYSGAVIYFYEGSTVLVPTMGGSEVLARRMVKVK